MSGSGSWDSPYLAVMEHPAAPAATDDLPPPTYLDNTLGGQLRLPRCLAAGFEPGLHAACGQCGRPMLYLMQLSCPLFGLDCRRFLYFFLCPGAACLDGPRVPLRCLRAQFPWTGADGRCRDQPIVGASPGAAPPKAPTKAGGGGGGGYAEWGEGADNWGDGDGDGESDGDGREVDDALEDVEGYGDSVATEAAAAAAEAVAALADTVVVPDVPGVGQRCRRLAVFDEADLPPPAAAVAPQAEVETTASSGAAADTGSDEDERQQALTRLEQKFYARLARCPGQLLRYQWAGRPLLVAPLTSPSLSPSPSPSPAPACGLCGRERVFELQLMPGLLAALRGAACDGDDASAAVVRDVSDRLDLATALVFVCAGACQQPAASFVEEAIVAQRELPPPTLLQQPSRR